MMKKKRTNYKGFTLIELLIVIGILGVLAVTVLLTLNPAESQRKSRDIARLKDVATLQAIVDQYINDNPTALWNNSGTVTSSSSRTCDSTGWLGIDACGYIQQLPIDPNQNTTRQVVSGSSTTSVNMNYRVVKSNGTYIICARQESKSNASKVTTDGGTAANNLIWFEAGSNLTLGCGT